jgi:predicted unusual protein kinase regulating ubiquinone biosynthesis (AarF/ABC1/UbiB family)
MTTSVMGKYAKARVESLFETDEEARETRAAATMETGQRIARTLGELKGAVMKIGQMASIGNELLPPELSQALGTLQKTAPPVAFEVIEQQIEREFGVPPDALFRRLDREPFAAASIGQVHRALTDDGREVVVKVQYPGVDVSVDSDLAQLKFVLRAAGIVRLRRKVLGELFSEVRTRLHEELDYTKEAANVREFRAFHLARGDSSLVIPEVVPECSSRRVLTLTYEPGDQLSTLEGLGYDQAARDRIGQLLVRMTASQLFEHHAVHADPNPANFAFRRDGTVVVYDFGCVKRLDPAIVGLYRHLTLDFLDADFEALDRHLIDLGARDPGAPPVPDEVYAAGREIFAAVFDPEVPFDFGNSTISRRLVELAPKFHRHWVSFQPPVAVVFVNRMMAGLVMNLRRLGARVALMPEILQYLEDDGLEPARGRRRRPQSTGVDT